MGIFWGFTLLWIGISYLGASMGWWSYTTASNIWLYWPLALIFGGLSAILRDNKYRWAILTALLLITTFVIYELSYASRPMIFRENWRRNYGQAINISEEDLSVEKESGAKDIKYKIHVGAIEARIHGTTDKALSGTFSSNMMGLSRVSNLFDDTQLIELTNQGRVHSMMWFSNGINNRLGLSLNKDLPVSLEIDSGASDLNFDLSEYILSDVTISAGASNIYVKLGEKIQNNTRIEVKGGASSAEIVLPRTIGARIKTNDGLSANDFEGFTKEGEFYVNETYKDADIKINIVLQTGVSAVEIRQY